MKNRTILFLLCLVYFSVETRSQEVRIQKGLCLLTGSKQIVCYNDSIVSSSFFENKNIYAVRQDFQPVTDNLTITIFYKGIKEDPIVFYNNGNVLAEHIVHYLSELKSGTRISITEQNTNPAFMHLILNRSKQ